MVALAAVWAVLPHMVAAQTQEAGVVTTLTGSATVTRAGASQHLRFKDSLFSGDTITTAEKSTLRVLLSCKAIVTVHEVSEWAIPGTGGAGGLGVSAGRLGLTIARQRMGRHESMQVRTPNAAAAVRGSSVIVEVRGSRSGAAIASIFSVLSGPVDISAGGTTVRVASHQRLLVRDNTMGVVEGLTPGEIEFLAAGLKGGARQHAGATSEFRELLTARERDRALGHVFGRVDGSAGGSPSGPRRDEILVAPGVSDLRHDNDTRRASDRCAAQSASADGIVRESDTGKSAP